MMPFGPAVDYIQAVLSKFPAYREYRSGRISREQYVERLEAQAAELRQRLGKFTHLYDLAISYPADFDTQAEEIFSTLLAQGFVPEQPAVAPFNQFRQRILASYDHGRYHTYIHPDEARLLYFISMARKPRHMVAIGSFYGYWAAWAMPGVQAAGGEALLVDPNREVCALAEENLRKLGFADRTIVRAEKAETVLPTMDGQVELALLDATGPPDHPDPAYRGKGIYGFLIKDIFAIMRDGALLVVHNDSLPENDDVSLESFHAFCRDHFRKQLVAPTPEVFGVYLK